MASAVSGGGRAFLSSCPWPRDRTLRCPPPPAPPQGSDTKLLRKLLDMLRWSGTVLHALQTQSAHMPAHALSRLSTVAPAAVRDATVEATDRWSAVLCE